MTASRASDAWLRIAMVDAIAAEAERRRTSRRLAAVARRALVPAMLCSAAASSLAIGPVGAASLAAISLAMGSALRSSDRAAEEAVRPYRRRLRAMDLMVAVLACARSDGDAETERYALGLIAASPCGEPLTESHVSGMAKAIEATPPDRRYAAAAYVIAFLGTEIQLRAGGAR